MIKPKNQKGFVAFTSILVVAAVVFAIVSSIPILGVDEAQGALGNTKSSQTTSVVQGCLDEALLRLRKDGAYTGGSLSLGDGSCIISISESSGVFSIDIEGSITGPPDYNKKLQAQARRANYSINLLSVNEVQ